MLHTDALSPSYDTVTTRAATAAAPTAPRQLLQQDIARALHENLARGYLQGEEHFRQIADSISDIVALTNHDFSKIYFVNAAYERIWGRSRETLSDDPLSFLEGVHPDDRARVHDAIFAEPRGNFDIEYRVVSPAGDQRWVWGRGFPVLDKFGEVYRIATVTEDISDRKAVADSRHRLVRGFTHDVKNPLGAADGFLALLEMGISGELTDTQRDHIRRARRDIRIALDLVVQLLEIERAEAGELILNRQRFDLARLVADGVEDYRSAAAEKQMSLSVSISGTDEELNLDSDRARVRQIVVNLISNAVKYTQPGGSILVSVRAAGADRADVPEAGDAPRRGRWAVVSVADTGPGIPPEKQPLLFREFTRFAPDAAAGSGLGLAISQNLARALGGEIAFRSAVGVGSTFSLWIPVAPSL